MRPETQRTIAGLATTVVGTIDDKLAIVFLHGFSMHAGDFAPFAHSLGVSAQYWFPNGPVVGALGGRAWWDIDLSRRAESLADGPRDLYMEIPPGRDAARTVFAQFLDEIRAEVGSRPLVIVGFSQGGMLAFDHVLHAPARPAALALLSSSRIAWPQWQPRLAHVQGLPMFVSHGRTDDDLAFAAGEAIRDAALQGGALVTWLPFDGGHGVPMIVWRGLRKFLNALG
jgi:phospholipase/carboxylesterase